MNTKDNWLTTATIQDPVRAAVWGSIFPGARLPIVSIIPVREDLPGIPGARVYMLDLAAITDEQRDQMVAALVDLFNLPAEEILKDLAERGAAILADNVSVESTDPAQLPMLILDDLGDDDD